MFVTIGAGALAALERHLLSSDRPPFGNMPMQIPELLERLGAMGLAGGPVRAPHYLFCTV